MERLWFIANLAEILEDREDFSLIRMHHPPGDSPPLHVHDRLHDMFYVLEGRLTVQLDGVRRELSPGSFVCVPPGVDS